MILIHLFVQISQGLAIFAESGPENHGEGFHPRNGMRVQTCTIDAPLAETLLFILNEYPSLEYVDLSPGNPKSQRLQYITNIYENGSTDSNATIMIDEINGSTIVQAESNPFLFQQDGGLDHEVRGKVII